MPSPIVLTYVPIAGSGSTTVKVLGYVMAEAEAKIN